jgi:hypothetical protein
MEMRLRLILSIAVLLVLAAGQPCFAKNSHAQHGARAGSSNSGASGKGVSGTNPVSSKAKVPIDAGETVAPPVFPRRRGVEQQQVRIINPSAKNLVNAPHGQTGVRTSTAPTTHNAIGQPVVPPKNLVGSQPAVLPALRASGAISPPILHSVPGAPGTRGGPAASSVVSSGNAANHGSVNGTTVIRPATMPPPIGGPAQPRYGINGTMVQNRH